MLNLQVLVSIVSVVAFKRFFLGLVMKEYGIRCHLLTCGSASTSFAILAREWIEKTMYVTNDDDSQSQSAERNNFKVGLMMYDRKCYFPTLLLVLVYLLVLHCCSCNDTSGSCNDNIKFFTFIAVVKIIIL
jgi:hypothetical protein